MNKVMVGFAVIGLAIGLAGCSQDEQESIFEAQLCIDNITVPSTSPLTAGERATLQTSVDTCLAKLSGTSKQAYVLRCSGDFIKQGIAEVALVSAIQDLDETNNTTDPSVTTMNTLAFDTIDNANAAVTNCTASESETLSALAGVASISTVLSTVAGGASNLQNFIDNYDSTNGAGANQMTTEEKQQLADTIISNQDSLCNPDSGLFKGNEFCDNIPADSSDKDAFINNFITNNQNANN